MSEDAGIEPRTVATFAKAVRRSIKITGLDLIISHHSLAYRVNVGEGV